MDFYKQFEDIKEEIKDLYLHDPRPIYVMVSFGKDSAKVLTLFWEALREIPLSKRTKKVHVISSDTLVESPSYAQYVKENMKLVMDSAKNEGLPIETHMILPKIENRYFFQFLAKGNPAPTEASRFRWCTNRLKQQPADQLIQELLSSNTSFEFGQEFDALMVLGVRVDESIRRKASIQKFQVSKESRFAIHQDHSNIQVWHPIKFISTDDLWARFYDYDTLPWGLPLERLLEMYPQNMMECPSMVGKSQGKSCGGGRNGCWTCLYTGPEDKMLMGLIEQGDTSMVPLAEYKKLLYAVRNDARYRDPQRRLAYKQINKREDTLDQVNIADYDNKYSNSTFQRGFTSEYSPGSITFEGRKLLLQKLLYVEKVSGHHLIDTDEVEAIINCWIDEGYDVCHNDVVPFDWQYDGPLVLYKDGSINYSQTKTNNPTFIITEDFSDGSDEVIQFLQKRQYKTGKSIFYILGHVEIDEDMVYNQAYFLVCYDGITTEEEAREYVNEWLGYNEPPQVESFDWKAYAHRCWLIALDPSCSKGRRKQINRLITQYGYLPVEDNFILEPNDIISDKSGQLTFAV